ncbi:CAP domain-containing protein [Streptomyces sp. MI02-2A]|nr:CAP domain-containing protein [Streptomyces sp. 3212.3]MDX3262915.1 CAP domain-containing protein [Streptomyces sp. MI02-2A]
MTPCPTPLRYSRKLHSIARQHSIYLASKPLEWVHSGSNMHTGPSGKFVWDTGEPMDHAGFHAFRAEIVADGFGIATDVVRFWMQDDEQWGWQHRNLILNSSIKYAGPGSYTSPSNHQFDTVDMGTL